MKGEEGRVLRTRESPRTKFSKLQSLDDTSQPETAGDPLEIESGSP